MPRLKGKLIDRLILQYGEELGRQKYENYKAKRKFQLSEAGFIVKYGEVLGKQKYSEFRNKTKFLHTKEDYIERYGDYGESKFENHKDDCRRTLNTFIKKYGEDLGKEKWNSYCRRQAETNSFEYKKEKYGFTKEQFDDYNKSRAITLENLISKYGEEVGKQKWKSYLEKQSYTKSLQYYIDEYGDIDGKIKFNELNRKKILSKENFIRKYGEETGNQKWHDYLENLKLSFSKSSKEFFDKVVKFNIDNVLFYGENEKKFLLMKDGISYASIDFYNETTNKGIEFFGDYWHANPILFEANELNKTTGLMSKEIWNHDRKRIELLKEKYDIDIKIIWESDKNNEEYFKELVNWIYSK